MPTHNLHGRRPTVAVAAAALAALLSVWVAPVASGARHADPAPAPTDPPVTDTLPPTTEAPTTTLPSEPSTTTPRTTTSTTTAARPGASTTTTTSTTVPGGPSGDQSQPGFVPTPLIPSASDDPLFHIARLVDADSVAVETATKAVNPAKLRYRAATRTAATARLLFEAAHRADVRAAGKAGRARRDLKWAAMRAYTGYQGGGGVSIDAGMATDPQTGGPARTYMALTTQQLRARIASAAGDHQRAFAALQVAFQQHRAAEAAHQSARGTLDAATSALKAAQHQLDVDEKELMAEVALNPDLAPGTLEKLPKTIKHEAGIVTVNSPAGTIVIPKKADKRTAVAVLYVVAQYGKPYLWGGTGPDRFDCSGLMLRAFQAAGVTSIPRVSQAQQAWATPVAAKDVQPGDLVFFGRPAYHVGMYIGGGLMIDAPYTGSVVRVDRVWPDTFSGFGRVIWP
jgi:cell wall-associated NlpC family hydrolase